MWVIYRDCQSMFVNLDKYTVDLVEDDDILVFQKELAGTTGRMYELQLASPYLQQFVTTGDVHYFAKHMNPWIKTL